MSSTSWHGIAGASKGWADPTCIFNSSKVARPNYAEVNASEYQDTEETLRSKVVCMADLIRASSNCCVYSGAGISTSSGISDYASKLTARVPLKKSGFSAQPSFAHFTLVELFKMGRLKRWIQQNHDGLPQKAGLPQSAINEIHGAWYDVTNPVVKFSGELKADLYKDLLEWEEKADLCLAVGTSMSGMNADRVFTTVSVKAVENQDGILGGIIINKQKTQYDNIATLRVFADINTVFSLLCEELEICKPSVAPYTAPTFENQPHSQKDTFLLGRYDRRGRKLAAGSEGSGGCVLDLSVGSRVELLSGSKKGAFGEVAGRNREGHYKIRFMVKLKKGGALRPTERIIGLWWIEAAVNGDLDELPIVNVGRRRSSV